MHGASGNSSSFETPTETFVMNENLGGDFSFAEQCMNFDDFPSFDALFTSIEPYTWVSIQTASTVH